MLVQLERKDNSANSGVDTATRGKLAFQLQKICKELQLDTQTATNEEDILDLIINKMTEIVQNNSNSVDMIKPIIDSLLELTEQQKLLVSKIEKAFNEVINYCCKLFLTISNYFLLFLAISK